MKQSEARLVAYRQAQRAMADLTSAVLSIIATAGADGISNSQVGRLLGIYQGHIGHEGHISRTMLELLKADGIIEQLGKGGPWRMKSIVESEQSNEGT